MATPSDFIGAFKCCFRGRFDLHYHLGNVHILAGPISGDRGDKRGGSDMVDTSKHAGLEEVVGQGLPAYASRGLERRASSVTELCARAYRFLGGLLDFKPRVTVLVLSEADWPSRSAVALYGMPNYAEGNLCIAGERAAFWREIVDGIIGAFPEAEGELRPVYGQPDGTIDVSPFFDLLAVHELAHEFHAQGGVRFPRLWLREFFCNLALHAFVASEEPSALPVLETFPRLVARIPATAFPCRTLDAFEAVYDGMPGPNYGWYQCRMHVAAKELYDAGGVEPIRRLWRAFRAEEAPLFEFLGRNVHPDLKRIAERLDRPRARAESPPPARSTRASA